MDFSRLCMSCMQKKGGLDVCMHCGWVEGRPQERTDHLAARTLLNGRYLVGRATAYTAQDVSYIAWDCDQNIRVLIREYLPRALAAREPASDRLRSAAGQKTEIFARGVENFLEQVHAMRELRHSSLLRITDCFKANGTAYAVLEYVDGEPLNRYLRQAGRMNFADAMQIIRMISGAVQVMHAKAMVHGAIHPGNLLVMPHHVKLTGFCTVCGTSPQLYQGAPTEPGYAAPEMYNSRRQPDVTADIYSLGAILYTMLTGKMPVSAVDRLVQDTLKSPSELGIELPAAADRAIMKALSVNTRYRFRSLIAFVEALAGNGVVARKAPQARIRRRGLSRYVLGMTAALLLSALGAAIFWANYNRYTLSVWYPQKGAPADPQADPITSVIQQIQEQYPLCDIELTPISALDYPARLAQAAQQGQMPALYYLPQMTKGTQSEAAAIGQLSPDLQELPILERLITGQSNYCPLGMRTYLIYHNKTIPGMQGVFTYQALLDGPPADLGEDIIWGAGVLSEAKAALPADVADALRNQLTQSLSDGKTETPLRDEYLLTLFSKGRLPYLIAGTQRHVQILNMMQRLEMFPLPLDIEYPIEPANIWCIGRSADERQQKAARAMLSLLLSKDTQEMMYLSARTSVLMENDAGVLPLQIEVLQKYLNKLQMEMLLGPLMVSSSKTDAAAVQEAAGAPAVDAYG